MKAKILKRRVLKDIPSASGIEVVGDSIYIIGDNSPYLFILDTRLKLMDKILLFPKKQSIIPKKEKADLEAITSFSVGGENMLLILGSGSYKKIRDKAFLIEPEENHSVKPLTLTRAYDFLRKQEALFKNSTLNIEAAVVVEEDIFLLQRGNISGNNLLIKYPLYSFLTSLHDTSSIQEPEFHAYPFTFKKCNGLIPGFSGATKIPQSKKILFTASLEDTPNEWYDGAIFESMVGIIDEEKTGYKISLIYDSDKPFKGKVESISVLKVINQKLLHALAVTDSDGSESEVLLLEVSF